MNDILQAGIEAMNSLKAMQDRMFPLIDEITLILEDARVELAAFDLREAEAHRRAVAHRIGRRV